MLRFATILLLFVALAPPSLAQDGAEVEARTYAQVMPEPVGGVLGIAERVQIPSDVLHSGLHGTVIVGVVVEPDGSVSEAGVLRGVHEALDAAALQAVLATPFEPGRQEGEAVRVRTAVPVQFALAAPVAGTEAAHPALSEPEEEVPTIYNMPDEPPRLIGGMNGFVQRLRYPRNAQRARAEGLIMVRFVVTPSGIPIGLEVVQGGHPALEAEALCAVSGARFVPGKVDATPVYVRFSMPVQLRLRNP